MDYITMTIKIIALHYNYWGFDNVMDYNTITSKLCITFHFLKESELYSYEIQLNFMAFNTIKNTKIDNKKNYNMKYHVILGRFKWLINVSPSLEGIRYPRSVYVLSFVCFFLLLLLFLYSLEKQFGWFLTHISRLHI